MFYLRDDNRNSAVFLQNVKRCVRHRQQTNRKANNTKLLILKIYRKELKLSIIVFLAAKLMIFVCKTIKINHQNIKQNG